MSPLTPAPGNHLAAPRVGISLPSIAIVVRSPWPHAGHNVPFQCLVADVPLLHQKHPPAAVWLHLRRVPQALLDAPGAKAPSSFPQDGGPTKLEALTVQDREATADRDVGQEDEEKSERH